MLNVNSELLASLGIMAWHARMDKHPTLDAHQTKFIFEPLRINPRCLVLIFVSSIDSTAAIQKIFDGMLSVLNLNKSEYAVVKVLATQPNLTEVAARISACKPQTILQLNMDFPIIVTNINTIRTYSPGYLLQNPAHKPQAYKDLLSLRNLLHHGTSSS